MESILKPHERINPRAQMLTILTRTNEKCRTAHIFVWDWYHWLTFAQLPDIRLIGTATNWDDAYRLINTELPGYRVRIKYCPRSYSWQEW